jgi:DMSO/TMAO reductase YedYZ molybdopterin-dependent catalytic subunit
MLSASKTRIDGILGIVAVGAGLAVAQLLSSIKSSLNGPIVSIGNRVIDHVPARIKEFAIRTFGVDDKRALVITISIVVLILAIIIGDLHFSGHRRSASLIVIFMTSIAVVSSIFDANANILSTLPSLAAGGTSILVLRIFDDHTKQNDSVDLNFSRRELFKTVGFIAVGSGGAVMAGNFFRTHASAQLQRLNIVLPKALKFLPPPPTDPALTTPGLSKLFTPNNEFYRIDTAITVPNINIDTWRLQIDGMVKNPLAFTYKELTDRPTFELDDTISCVSNEVGGNLVGNARWLGIRLDDLVKEASPLSSADQVMGHSIDGFTAGFPLAALDGRDAMIAIGMNGKPLPVDHGFPARIIVPGLYGYVSATKWLTRIELTRFDRAQGYWIPRGWSAQAPIKTASRIDTPFIDSKVKAGRRVIAGVAWAPTRGISKVEIRLNNGAWRPATLGPALAKTTWRQWWIDWDATNGETSISVRATDGTGALQSSKSVPVEPNGAEGWHTINVTVTT